MTPIRNSAGTWHAVGMMAAACWTFFALGPSGVAQQPQSPQAAGAKPQALRPVAVVCPQKAAFGERLAAAEVRRYIYACTGRLLPVVGSIESAPPGELIVVGLGCPMRLEELGLANAPQVR